MESDQVFQAEAEIEQLSRNDATHSESLHRGHDFVQAAAGGIEVGHHDVSEETPLLEQQQTTTSLGAASGNDPFEWSGAHDFDGLPWYKTPSVFWLLPAFLLFTMAFGGTFVPKINLILSLICRDYCAERAMKDPKDSTPNTHPAMGSGDHPECQIPAVQSLVAKFTLYMSLISGLLSALISPKIGSLSDRYGRKRLMWASTFGTMCGEVTTILVAKYPDMFPLNLMLLGALLDGLGGSFTAAMALAYAYASDVTPPDQRNVAFGYYHACLFCGIAFGPLIAGFLVKATGDILTIFYLAIGAHTVFLLWLIFVVPESLTTKRQHAARKKLQEDGDANHAETAVAATAPEYTIFRSIFRFMKGVNPLSPLLILWPTGEGTRPALRRNLFFLAAVDTTMFGVAMGSLTVVLIYSEYAFGWGTFETSIFVSIVNTCRVTVLIVLLPIFTRLIRGPSSQSRQRHSGCDGFDLALIRIAVIFDLLGYIGYSTVGTGSLFTLSGVIASLGGIGSPTLSSALTKHVPTDQTGKVLGAMGLLHAIARVVSPTVFNLIYAKTVGTHTQTVFICLAAMFGLALIFSLFIRPHIYWDEPHHNLERSPEEESTESTS